MNPDESRYPLPRFSVDRPITVIMFLLTLLVVGYIAYTRIPISLMPEGNESSYLYLSANYPNASPIDVEEKVARPLEEIVGTVPNVVRVGSYSRTGGCHLRIQFQPGTDMDQAYSDLRDRVDRVMADLPDEVDRVWVRQWNPEDEEIMRIRASAPADVSDPYYLIESILLPRLQRIEGVGSVDVWGIQSNEIQIEFDQEAVRSLGINISTLAGHLRQQNVTLPGGHVLEGGRKLYLRSVGEFRSLEELAQLPIDASRNLRLSDIATVRLAPPERNSIRRVNGIPSIGMEVKRTSTGNIVQISREVRAALEEMKRSPQMQVFDFQISSDQGEDITESINNLKSSIVWGGVFAFVVLFTFLRAIRITSILTLAIPLSLLASIVVLYFIGWSLNILTMMGLLLSLGLVIDNAIVIVENIYRRRQEGAPARAASIEGAGEVGLAITMATLTSIVVFLPLLIMSDRQEFSFWMLRIGVPVIASLVASLFIALVFVPLAAQRLSRGKHRDQWRLIAGLQQWQQRSLSWALNHRLDAMLLVLLAMSTIAYPISRVQRTDRGQGSSTSARFFFDSPSGLTVDQLLPFYETVEQTIFDRQDAYGVDRVETSIRVGRGDIELHLKEPENSAWYAAAFEDLQEWLGWRRKQMTVPEIQADLQKHVTIPAGFSMRTNWRDRDTNTGSSVSITLYGEDTQTLLGYAESAAQRLGNVPGVISVDVEAEPGSSEFRVIIDREQARRLGINPNEINSGISDNMRGRNVGRFQGTDGREIDIRVQLAEADRQSLEDLRTLNFETEEGIRVPLESVATFGVADNVGRIRRENRQTSIRVTATVGTANTRAIFDQIDHAMQGFEMPRGYRWDKGSRFFEMQQSDKAQRFALLISVCFVFFLMGILFESFVLPLSVIVSVPFAFLGVYWTLFLTDTPFDQMSKIGTIILVGVVVNNAIVLVDLTNRLRLQGLSRYQALMKAGHDRFRPILMTTFTTIFGLIPMAVGNSKVVGMPYAPLGRTMIGGLLVSMFLTLVVVPLFYTFFDDLRNWVREAAASVAGNRKEEPAAAEVPR